MKKHIKTNVFHVGPHRLIQENLTKNMKKRIKTNIFHVGPHRLIQEHVTKTYEKTHHKQYIQRGYAPFRRASDP